LTNAPSFAQQLSTCYNRARASTPTDRCSVRALRSTSAGAPAERRFRCAIALFERCSV